MPGFLRLRLPSPAMVVACLALALALGGTSYAVVKPGRNSVGSRELRKGAVANSDLKNNAVTSSKVKDDELTGRDLVEATLGPVPTAANALHAGVADRAAAADRAGIADSLAQVVYRTTTATIGPAPADPNLGSTESAPTVAACPAGHHVVGGGVQLEDNMSQIDGYPSSGGTGWTARAANDDITAPHSFTVYAICVASATIG